MPTPSMNDLLKRMTDIGIESTPHQGILMIYGASGSGKTTLAARVAQELLTEPDDRVLYVDAAEGWVSLEDTYMANNTTRFRFEKYVDLIAAAELVRTKHKRVKGTKVVIIDEWDNIADSVLNAYVRGKNNTAPGDETPEIEGRDHAPMRTMLITALDEFLKQGLHVILVAHDAERKIGGVEGVTGPSLSPKFKAATLNLLHVMAYASSVLQPVRVDGKGTFQQVHRVQAVPTKLVEGKSRIPALSAQVHHTHEEFIEHTVAWIKGDSMGADLATADEQAEQDDPEETPVDPDETVAVTEADDAPAYSE